MELKTGYFMEKIEEKHQKIDPIQKTQKENTT